MKKKLLLKTMLLLCALVAGSSSVWAQGDESTNHTGNVTLSTSGGTNAAVVSVTIGTDNYSAIKIGKNGNSGSFNITAPVGTKYLHIHVAAWNGKSPKLSVKNGSTNIATNISLTSDASISGTATTFDVDDSKVATDYYKVVTLTSALASEATLTIATSNERAVVWGVTAETIASGSTEAPTISGNTPFFGSTTVTITNAASADGANRYYTLNGDDPTTTTSATCFAYSAPFSIDATTTVKAIAKKSTDTNASPVVSKTFTMVTPITVAAALTAIDALSDNATIADQAVRGIITQVNSYADNTISYVISDDVSGSNTLTVYKGKGLHNADFSAQSDLKLGDDVVIYGTLKKYVKNSTTTPEFDAGSYLLYKESKTAPTFTLSTTAETLSMGTKETVDVTLTTNTDGTITCESSDDDVATVALKSAGVYTITGHMAGTATITIKSALTENYQPASETVSITVEDTREAAGISFTEDEEEITWGDTYTGQALTNSHNLPVTWSSTDETVASVNASGVVSVLKAGTTDIKATFVGDATYKSAVASYTLTINKADAGLSFDVTEYDFDLDDDSFTGVEVNNPNSLPVTYSSSDEDVAILIDENTGEVLLEASVAGTATITASFSGNDYYKSGSASYTINIFDFDAKGGKYNPYTVAEVIDGTATGSNIYVKGFIVGEYVGKTTNPRTSGFTTDANIAIADPFTTSPTASGSIPVALPTDALKSAWGCQASNGALLGYEILVKGNKDTYFSVNGIKNTSEITAISIPIKPAKTYTTLTSAYALDFTDVNNDLKAFIATEVSGGKVQMAQVNKVPAGTGLVLKATTPNSAVNVPVFDGTGADNVSANKMAGSATATTHIAENGGYILKDGVFQPSTEGDLPAGKAYLNIAVTSAPVLELNFGEATAIEKIANGEEPTANGQYYNMNGQRVAQPTKGLYIVNGRKVVIK